MKYENAPDFPCEVRAMIPAAQYKIILAIAAEHSLSTAEVVGEIIRRTLNAPAAAAQREQSRKQRLAEIRRLHALGLNDRQIGEQIGARSSWVRDARHSLGLPANDPRGGGRKKDLAMAPVVVRALERRTK